MKYAYCTKWSAAQPNFGKPSLLIRNFEIMRKALHLQA
jgi:hypothetical protein